MASVLQSSNIQHEAINALADKVENLKISTLVNAAKISPLVQERTIGPKDSNENLKNEPILSKNDCANSRNSSTNVTPTTCKFRKDVWREVSIQPDEDQTPKNTLHLNDYKAIKFRLASCNAEKQRRAKISTDLQEKQNQWDTELEQRLQQIRIDSAEKQKQTQAKRLEREMQTLKAIEKIEAQAQQDELKSNAKKNEMIEHSRRLIERANQLKRQDELRLLIESINASNHLFINLKERYEKTRSTHHTVLDQCGKLAEFTSKFAALLQRYEKIMISVNSKHISIEETELFELLCLDIKQEQNELDAVIESCRETLSQNGTNQNGQTKNANMSAIANEPIQSAVEGLKASNANEVSVTDGTASVNNIGTGDRIAQYYELMNYYQEYEAQIQPLVSDVNMKKFRFNCQKGVNTPINSIAACSAQHLQDKFEKISELLSGNQVRIGSSDIPFSALEHPLGVKYCTLLLAKKFITQGTTVTSSHHQAAFPIAAIIVSIWQLFPDVGKLFMALLYIECPFFVPYFVPRKSDQSEIEYFSLLGYNFNDGKMEEQEQYLKRISGLQRLYAAIQITKLRRNQQYNDHPHGIENGWIWFSNFLMLVPLPGISATLLLEFIQICGAEMWQAYKKQFMKLMIVLHNCYISNLSKNDSGGPFARLKDLVNTIVKENKITPPAGTLQPNFW